MKLEYLLLGVLLMKPRTGYDLKRFMDMEGVFLRANTQMSQVYRSLTHMHEQGFVAYTVSDRPGAQDAKVYEVTPAGRLEFMSWLERPYQPTVGRVNYDLSARMFFAGFIGEEALVSVLTQEIRAREEQIAKYRFRDRTIEVSAGSGFDLELGTLVENFSHVTGARAMDEHLARMIELRDLLLERIEQLNTRSTTMSTARAANTKQLPQFRSTGA